MTFLKNKSILIATGLAVVIALWLISGMFKEDEVVEAKSVVHEQAQKTIAVQVKTQTAITHPDVIRLFGQTEADREVQLKAETTGRIEEVLITKGQSVRAGDVIAKISMDDRTRKLASAQALLRQRQLEFDANKALSKKSFRSQTTLAEAEAQLHAARAELDNIRLDIAHTSLKAPFDGFLEDRLIEPGDFVENATAIAHIVDLSPLVIRVNVAEVDIAHVEDGQTAQVRLADGILRDGIVRYVARSSSDSTTRTYGVEIEIENPGTLIPAGLTAEVRLQGRSEDAYLVSPSILTLAENGAIGIKTVNDSDMVEFHTVKIIEDTTDGLWISGLPKQTRIITLGQEYVTAGQKVSPQEKSGE